MAQLGSSQAENTRKDGKSTRKLKDVPPNHRKVGFVETRLKKYIKVYVLR